MTSHKREEKKAVEIASRDISPIVWVDVRTKHGWEMESAMKVSTAPPSTQTEETAALAEAPKAAAGVDSTK